MPRDETPEAALNRPAQAEGRPRMRPAEPMSLPATMDQEAFLGVLSHELRTPVTTIYGGAQLLATRDLPESRRRALASDVSQEAERLFRIVEDLVVLLRSERGELRSADEPVAIGRLIVSAIQRELDRNPRLRIHYLGASDAAAEQADELLTTHAIRNLLDNAIRNTAGAGPVEVVVDTEEDEVVVRVLDRGPRPLPTAAEGRPGTASRRPAPGSAKAPHPTMGASGQLDPAGTPAGLAGGGLGLFVAARLVQAMQGRSWVRPRPGGGAEFGFALRRSVPIARPASA